MSNSEEQDGSARPPAQPFSVGAWRVDPALDELRKPDRTVKLEPRMMRMLCVLAERPGEVVSANDLLDKVWPGVVVGPNSVYQAIAQLRRLLGDDGEEPQYIATVSRKGYRLIAPVKSGADSVATIPERNQSIGKSRKALLIAAAAVGVGLTGWWWLRSAVPPPANIAANPIAIAVLPFADLSVDGNNAAFCDGLTEELLNSLARVSGLRVSGRTSAFRFRDGGASNQEISAQLGVTHLLEGSVRHSGQQLRVSARLISTANGREVWGKTFDRPRADALAIQSEILSAVVNALKVQLAPSARQRLENTPTTQVNAHELYLLGRYHQLQRNPEALQRAINYHQQAIAADARFALAHAGLAEAYMAGYYYQNRTLEATARLVQPEVDAALKLDPELAEAYAAQALLHIEQGHREEAIKELKRAISINPNFGDAYLRLGTALEYDGRPLEALAAYDQVAALDPLHTMLHVRRCLTLQNLGRYAEAQRACDRGFELQPDIPNALWASALNAYAQGDLVAAIGQHIQALERAPHRADIRGELGLLYLDVGLPVEAEHVFAAGLSPASAGGIDLQLTSLLALGAKNDTPALRLALSKGDLLSDADPRQIVHAAFLALVAGDAPQAEAWRAKALRTQSDAQDALHLRLYPTRWGVCDLCVYSLLERRHGNASSADKLARFASNWLDEVEADGHRWHGLHYARATLLAPRGRTEEALASLERAYELGWRRAWLMRIDPALAELRAAPRFVSLIERIERDAAAARARLLASAGSAPAPAR